jgi:glycosyltransferase involved in cell wall biosynthesis
MIVSLVTPSLNGIRYLPECIKSTKRQNSNRVEVEHIVVDGGSTDGTPEYAASQGCRVLYREGGITDALNVGSQAANGVLLGILGCDDLLVPGALDTVVADYERSGRNWLVGGCRWLDLRGRDIGTFRSPPAWLTPPMLASLGWSCIPTTSTFIHRNLLDELQGFNASFEYGSDYDLFVRALEEARFSRIGQVLSCCYRHGANVSTRLDEIHRSESGRIAEVYAPALRAQRRAYQLLLKTWLNATNPRWFAMKMVHKVWQPTDAHIGAA